MAIQSILLAHQTCMLLDCGKNLEYPEETHVNTLKDPSWKSKCVSPTHPLAQPDRTRHHLGNFQKPPPILGVSTFQITAQQFTP